MLSAFLAVAVASLCVDFIPAESPNVTISGIPGITGCYRTSSGVQIFITFILLFAFQLGVASLTFIRAIQSWWMANHLLYAVLVKHNIFYYVCGLSLSTVNILTQMLFSDIAYRLVIECLQFFILAILATRMHLHLWKISQHADGSDALVRVPMTDVSSADSMVTTV